MELPQSLLGQGSTDLESLRDDGGCDQLVARHLLVQLVICWLIKQDQVVQLVTDFSFGPLLLTEQSTWYSNEDEQITHWDLNTDKAIYCHSLV